MPIVFILNCVFLFSIRRFSWFCEFIIFLWSRWYTFPDKSDPFHSYPSLLQSCQARNFPNAKFKCGKANNAPTFLCGQGPVCDEHKTVCRHGHNMVPGVAQHTLLWSQKDIFLGYKWFIQCPAGSLGILYIRVQEACMALGVGENRWVDGNQFTLIDVIVYIWFISYRSENSRFCKEWADRNHVHIYPQQYIDESPQRHWRQCVTVEPKCSATRADNVNVSTAQRFCK